MNKMYRLLVILVTACLQSAQAATPNWTPTKAIRGSSGAGSCQLPNFPSDGRYTVCNYNGKIVPGDVVSQFTVLNYTCNDNLDPTAQFSWCQENNTWSSMPECERRCIMPSSYTVDFKCYSPSGPIPCSPALPSGSTIHPTCKDGHVSPDDLFPQTCNRGNWINPTPECRPDCGLEKEFSRPYIVNGITVKRNTFPWHVAIFQDMGNPVPDQICGGSLVRSHLVISAAHCFYDPIRMVSIDSRYYKVACGKFYRSWDSEADDNFPYVQKSEVKQLVPHNDYVGDEQNFQNDIAILVLATPFRLSDSVRPVCMDLQDQDFDDSQIRPGNRGRVAGWGLTESGQSSETLRSLEMPVIEYFTCREEMRKYKFSRFVTRGKICAGYTNGSALCQGDSGGGLVFPAEDYAHKTRWYLRGVVSNGPLNEAMTSCRANTYTAFTNIFKLREWLKTQMWILRDGDSARTPVGQARPCTAPTSNSVNFACRGPTGQVPCSSTLPSGTTITSVCKDGLIAQDVLLVLTCRDGRWDNPTPECTTDQCTTPTSNTVDFTCYGPTGQIPCSTTLPSGTIIASKCKDVHVSMNELKDLKCHNGRWDNPTPKCNPECGLENRPSRLRRVVNGADADRGAFPWHVGIYKNVGGGRIENTCGGTLVQSNVVISAAHCFYNSARGNALPAVRFRVAVGKINRSWDTEAEGDLESIQKIEIKRIILHEEYSGDDGFQQADVSLLELATPVRLSAAVRPICLDLVDEEFDKRQIEPQKFGKVAGWGDTEKGEPSETLKTLSVPVVGYDECQREMTKYKFRYLTRENLCAGYTNGSAICKYDGGGGLVFPDEKMYQPTRWYLRAVVSNGPFDAERTSCRSNSYTVYTHVFKMRDWISRQLSEIN